MFQTTNQIGTVFHFLGVFLARLRALNSLSSSLSVPSLNFSCFGTLKTAVGKTMVRPW